MSLQTPARPLLRSGAWGAKPLYAILSIVLFASFLAWPRFGHAQGHAASRNELEFLTPRVDVGATGYLPETLPEDLALVWEAETAEAIETTPIVDRERVYVADVMGGMEALRRTDGVSVWRKEFDTGFVASPALLSPTMVTSQRYGLPILSKSDEPIEPAREADLRTRLAASLRPLLIAGDVDGQVWAVDPATGETVWRQATDGEINASPTFYAIEPDSADAADPIAIRVLVTSQDGRLRSLDARTGEPQWTYATNDQIRCGASIGLGNTFLGGCDGALHVVDLRTGQAVGDPLELGGPTGSTPAVVGGEVFLPIMAGVAYRFDAGGETPVTYQPRWSYEDGERDQEYRGDFAIGPDRVVISSREKNVDAIDRDSGKRLWRMTLKRRADASPLIVGDDVWIASTDGRLLRLSLTDGTERWSYEIRGAFIAAPAIAGDCLIIADDEGVVRCFAAKAGS